LLTVTCITAVKCILPLLFESPSYLVFYFIVLILLVFVLDGILGVYIPGYCHF